MRAYVHNVETNEYFCSFEDVLEVCYSSSGVRLLGENWFARFEFDKYEVYIKEEKNNG